ncbi:hypothetical protein, partial [Leptolyngbya sp. FACHB-711]|uniref:hypothetical protein n=1 Tax=Leptolyngbya sp. FACHB-711 TaxID=2692813 RepID=UPI001A7E3C95
KPLVAGFWSQSSSHKVVLLIQQETDSARVTLQGLTSHRTYSLPYRILFSSTVLPAREVCSSLSGFLSWDLSNFSNFSVPVYGNCPS